MKIIILATTFLLGYLAGSEPISYDDMDGSPYYHDDFALSSGMKANGKILDSIQLKYDLVAHSFLAKLEDGKVITVDDKQFREFRMNIDGEEILFKRVDPKFPNRFYEIIYSGKDMTIYKSEVFSVVKAENKGFTKSKNRFISKKIFLVKKGRQIERVKLKKKDLWKYFDKEKREILDAHLKKNKMKLKKVRDYRKLFEVLQGFA